MLKPPYGRCPSCGGDVDTISTLRADLAAAIAERDEARGQLAAAQRELHRLTHGEDIEGDGVCRHEIDAQAARAERDRYRAALRDVAREWPYLDLMDPATVQERDLRGVIDYLLRALHSEQRTAREALEGQTDA